MATKRALFPAQFKALDDKGKVEAIVSVFGNVDHIGDRVMPGAFAKTIAAWKESGDPIPVIYSHDSQNVWSHIGVVDELQELPRGLKAVYSLDIDTNPVAAQVYRLLKRRSLKQHSFQYAIRNERTAKDGANELIDLDLIELGPTLRGMNPETELLSVKALDEAIDEAIALEKAAAEVETKAGRRISRATESELSAAIDGMEKELQRLRGLLSAGDSEKQEEDEEDIAGKSSTDDDAMDNSVVDDDLLIFKTRIESMR